MNYDLLANNTVGTWMVQVVCSEEPVLSMRVRSHSVRWLAKQRLGTERVMLAVMPLDDSRMISGWWPQSVLRRPWASVHAWTPWRQCLPEERDYYGLAAHADVYREGRGGLYKEGGEIVWLHSGSLHSQRWLEVRSTGYLSRKHQSSAEEVVSTITSVRGARYDVGSVRFSNKSASNGPSPVPSV